jgi:hypothetical protein
MTRQLRAAQVWACGSDSERSAAASGSLRALTLSA